MNYRTVNYREIATALFVVGIISPACFLNVVTAAERPDKPNVVIILVPRRGQKHL